MSNNILILLLLLNVCHWAADYTHLSNQTILAAKRFGTPLRPIFEHACRHGGLMIIVLLCFKVSFVIAVVCYLFEVFTHFIIDTLKGRLNKWFPKLQSPANKYHWYIFGADQFLHQLVIILIVKIAS